MKTDNDRATKWLQEFNEVVERRRDDYYPVDFPKEMLSPSYREELHFVGNYLVERERREQETLREQEAKLLSDWKERFAWYEEGLRHQTKEVSNYLRKALMVEYTTEIDACPTPVR